MATELDSLLMFICQDLDLIKCKDDFENYFNGNFRAEIELIKKEEFVDLQYKHLPVIRDNNYSYTYVYQFKCFGDKTMKHFWSKVMYIDTIHGAWIVVDLMSEEIIKEIGYIFRRLNTIMNYLDTGMFQDIKSKNYIKLTYYPDIDKFIAIVANSLELYDHPWYSWNKILDNFSYVNNIITNNLNTNKIVTQIDGNTNNIVTDIDGNIYHSINIGSQVWMLENLKVTKYCNGDPIPIVTDSQWENLRKGAYCYYDNDNSNGNIYGCLYNWYAVKDSRKIAPPGWKVPSFDEWSILIDYLGGGNEAGGRLKEKGTLHWNDPNEIIDNSIGFSALPGGIRTSKNFSSLGIYGHWWTSSEAWVTVGHSNILDAWYVKLFFLNTVIFRLDTELYCGLSIRCIKE
jgi:uncharacterized protein (TIGR02145 family)